MNTYTAWMEVSKKTTASGMVETIVKAADPRFGIQAPINKTIEVQSPGGITYTQSIDSSVTLSDISDPLSLVSYTDSYDINGQVETRTYDSATSTETYTSAMGRQEMSRYGSTGKLSQLEIAGLTPVEWFYNGRGQTTEVRQGNRSTLFSYNVNGYVDNVTNPNSEVTQFAYDGAGRVVQKTLPDSRAIQVAYDSNGNMTSLTPPNGYQHQFGYNASNFLSSYMTPDSGSGPLTTQYNYDLDNRLAQVIRADGKMIDYNYETGKDRLMSKTSPELSITYSYHPTQGQLTAAATSAGENLNYSYDGELVTGVSWSGAVNGYVNQTYNNDLRVQQHQVSGQMSVSYSYDSDGLLIGAGGASSSILHHESIIGGFHVRTGCRLFGLQFIW